MSDYTPEQDELLAVIETAHRESWDDATEYADAPHVIRAAVVRWLAEHDRQVAERGWDEGRQSGYNDRALEYTWFSQNPNESYEPAPNPYREVTE